MHAVQNHAVALGDARVVPVADGGGPQLHIAIQVEVGLRRVEGRMGPHEARHEEERARAIARLEEADRLVDHPVGGMQALLVCPRVRDPRVVLHAGSVHVGEFTQLVLEEAHVVVGDVLVHPVGQVRLTVMPDVAVVQAHVLEAAAEARRVHVHLADHGRLVAAVASIWSYSHATPSLYPTRPVPAGVLPVKRAARAGMQLGHAE